MALIVGQRDIVIPETDLSPAVIVAPDTTERNLIQSGQDITPLELRAYPGQTEDLLKIQASDGSDVATVEVDGTINSAVAVSAPTLMVEASGFATSLTSLASANRAVSFPDLAGTIVLESGFQAVSDKTLASCVILDSISIVDTLGGGSSSVLLAVVPQFATSPLRTVYVPYVDGTAAVVSSGTAGSTKALFNNGGAIGSYDLRAIAASDLPTVTTAKGGTGLTSIGSANQVLGVNNGAAALEYKTITAGSNVTVTHGANSITIAATGGSGAGTASITGDTNNLSSSTYTLLRISADAAGYFVSGLADGSAGRSLKLRNSGSHPFILSHEDSNSTAANRFTLPRKLRWCIVRPGDVYEFIYDEDSDRWEYVSGMDGWWNDPKWCSHITETFLGGTTGSNGSIGQYGWGTAGMTSSIVQPASEPGITGQRILRTTSTAFGDRVIHPGQSSSGAPLEPDTATADTQYLYEAIVKIPILSDGTDNCYYAAGIGSATGGFGNNIESNEWSGVMFVYNYTVSDNWRIFAGNTNDSLGSTLSTTSTAVTTDWTKLSIVWESVDGSNNGNDRAHFYIDDTFAATSSATTFPTTGIDTVLPCAFQFRTAAGSGNRDFHVDAINYSVLRMTPLI